jgi:hypothetical protein
LVDFKIMREVCNSWWPLLYFLSRSVQDINYLNGNLGKTAVGNFSLDMILNSLGQYVKTPLFSI